MRRLYLLAFIWGWSFLFIKVAVEGMTPTTVAAGRIALGAAVLHVVLRLRRMALPRDLATWRHFVVVGLVGNVVPFTALAWGEERITSALTAVLNASTPFFTALAGAYLLRERLKPVQLLGLVVGAAGVAVAAGLGGADIGRSSLAGSMAPVLAGACYGIAFAYMKKHLMGMPPLAAAAGQLTAGAVLLAPVAVATTITDGFDPAPHRLLAIVLLGAVGTGAAYVLSYGIVAEVGPTKASLVTYLVPAVAVAVGVVVLGEPFELRLVAGGVLIVGGIALVHERVRLRPRSGDGPPIPVGSATNGPGGRRRRRWPFPPPAPHVLLVVALAAGLVGCGGGDEDAGGAAGTGPSGACGPIEEEPLDPGWLLHVLPGTDDPEFLTDPPTSGPHLSARVPIGALDEPLSGLQQVTLLERGDVVIQYDDSIDPSDLRELAGGGVTVAPNPGLPAPVVATAWRHKRTCTAIDTDALRAFVDARLDEGPATHDDHGP